MSDPSPLSGVEVLLFDTFGTLTDWETSVSNSLKVRARHDAKKRSGVNQGLATQVGVEVVDWLEFARDWRKGYLRRTREIAEGKQGPSNIDELHLELLNELLERETYSAVAQLWSAESDRKRCCQMWHHIEAWPDVKPGMGSLRKLDPPILLATLSNGSLRLLVDVARTNGLAFDAHFSGDLLQSYKPNPKMYLGAPKLLGYDEDAIKQGKVAMVASHIYDLKAASQYGLKTVYIPRSTEDVGNPEGGAAVRSKADGGTVDVVLHKGLEELRNYFKR